MMSPQKAEAQQKRRAQPSNPRRSPALALAGEPSIRGLASQAAAHGVLEL